MYFFYKTKNKKKKIETKKMDIKICYKNSKKRPNISLTPVCYWHKKIQILIFFERL